MAPRRSEKKSSWEPLAMFLRPIGYIVGERDEARRKAKAKDRESEEGTKALEKAIEDKIWEEPAAQSNAAPVPNPVGHEDIFQGPRKEKRSKENSRQQNIQEEQKEFAVLAVAAGGHASSSSTSTTPTVTNSMETSSGTQPSTTSRDSLAAARNLSWTIQQVDFTRRFSWAVGGGLCGVRDNEPRAVPRPKSKALSEIYGRRGFTLPMPLSSNIARGRSPEKKSTIFFGAPEGRPKPEASSQREVQKGHNSGPSLASLSYCDLRSPDTGLIRQQHSRPRQNMVPGHWPSSRTDTGSLETLQDFCFSLQHAVAEKHLEYRNKLAPVLVNETSLRIKATDIEWSLDLSVPELVVKIWPITEDRNSDADRPWNDRASGLTEWKAK
ncbi:MAG: hypothetical protein M1812_007423 [Candelaria pacifica]|nr:MAG: hypothetical protein M1812_007423 [Candelaria pacifica]